jgi:hypothetical protein
VVQEREQRTAQKAKLQLKAKLSFAEDEDEEEGEEHQDDAGGRNGADAAQANVPPAAPAAAQSGAGSDREPSAATGPTKGKLGARANPAAPPPFCSCPPH